MSDQGENLTPGRRTRMRGAVVSNGRAQGSITLSRAAEEDYRR